MCSAQGYGLPGLRSTRLMKKTRYAAVLKMRLASVYLTVKWMRELFEMKIREDNVRKRPRIGIGMDRR